MRDLHFRRVVLFLLAGLAAGSVLGDARTLLAQGQNGQTVPVNNLDATEKRLKQAMSAASEQEIPALVDETLTVFANTKIGSWRIRDVVAERSDSTVPLLFAIAINEEHPHQAIAESVLGGLLPKSEPRVIAGLADDDPAIRRVSMRILGTAMPSETSREAIIAALVDEDADVRHRAAIRLLSSSHAHDRVAEIMATEFEQFGEHKHLALRNFLLWGLQHPAARELARIFVSDSDRVIRSEAALSLMHTDLLSNDAIVPALLDGIAEPPVVNVFDASLALAEIGPQAKPALERLQELADTQDESRPEDQAATQLAICSIDRGQTPQRLPCVLECLGAEQLAGSSRRSKLLRQLAGLGTDAQSAIPSLETMFNQEDELSHVDLALVIVQIDPAGPERGLNLLRKVLSRETPNPDRGRYDWRPVAATAVLADDVLEAFRRTRGPDRMNQLGWIWSNVIPRETAEAMIPQVEEIMETKQNKRLRQAMATAISRVEDDE